MRTLFRAPFLFCTSFDHRRTFNQLQLTELPLYPDDRGDRGEYWERKLTAILCADVYGYSRLMGEDEEATLRTLSSHRKIIDR